MIHVSNCASSLRLMTASSLVVVAGLVFVSAARAVDFDFNAASGNYNVAGNWVDLTGVASPAVPTVVDRAFVRNNGTVTVNSNVAALQMRIGYGNVVTAADYNGNGTVDAADYVLWRKGGPLQNDATPADVGPDDYLLWRRTFGAAAGLQNLGAPGTLNWTAGEITGTGPIGGDPYSGGPDIRVGRVETTSAVLYDITGTVVQNGPSTKLLLPYRQSQLTIGDGTSTTNNPTSSYTLMDGTIGLAIGSSVFQNDGTNGNNGIHVRNGTFAMAGGQIIDVTPPEYFTGGALVSQRFLTVATATGVGVGNESVATATLSGGNINVLGGFRVATANHSRGYLNINGPVTIVTGGDTSIGYQPNTNGINAVGEMNMSAGSLQVGRTDIMDIDPNTGLPRIATALNGRFQIGDRGLGKLNMSGGSISVTRNVRVTNQAAAGGSIITMTGGSITTPGLEMRVVAAVGPDDGASIILDGPTATFTTTGVGASPTTIGNNGKALFEVRQGTAILGGAGSTIEVGSTALSAATINVKGGKLTLGGRLNRANLASTAPDINLTGGTLEFNNTTSAGAHIFYADLNNEGSKLVAKPNAVQLVQVGSGSPSVPANFAMTSGSWDIEIGAHNIFTGADSFNIPTGTASLTGGMLNISYLAGFTPNLNEEFRILRASLGTTLTGGAVSITGAGAGSWSLIEVPISGTDEEIRLKFVGPGAGAGLGGQSAPIPEPSSAALAVLALVAMFSGSRKRTSA